MHRSITRTYLKHYANVHDGAAELMPLTGAQRRFQHARSTDPHDRAQILPVFLEFPPGLLSAQRLEQAARSVLLRHPALRGAADTAGGVPVLRIHPLPEGPVVREITAPDTDLALSAALDHRPTGSGAFRVLLARDERRDLLAIGFDHLVCDGESTGLVLDELVSEYHGPAGEPDSAAAAATLHRYREAVEQQLEKEHAASGPEALDHWTSRVRDAGPGLWGTDAPEPGTSASIWQRVTLSGPAALRPFPAVLDGCHQALSRLAGTAPVAYTWGSQDGAGVVGCFINTVLANPQDEGVSESWLDDLEFLDTPFDEVVRAARACQAPWTGHLDLVLTLIDRTRRPAPVLEGEPGRFRYPSGHRAHQPVVVSALHDGGELSLRVDHDPALVSGATATAIADVLCGSLAGTTQ
ncbi:condensation domain-containing protein [Kitasatospora viridis]|uniref:Condensation domain-containing protein n=1 Tax=Kitasatospora viridis TaxID=281105 RepID=A0A561UIP4_9ACTN|nr:condensation domain-containing protein [Kitasatospora viridis]TWF99243.1 condensation domain-containing protein [Kitasatospora viridis]